MNKKFLYSPLSIKSIGENSVFSGYASVFNIIDKQNDLILPGAFKKNLNRNKIKLLWQHNPDEPIGSIIDIYENDVGLYITAHLLLGIQKAEENTYQLSANKASTPHSSMSHTNIASIHSLNNRKAVKVGF